ncbi:MAG: hypothetical protein ACI82S_002973, partial [Patiriisocius sp.]
MTSRILPIFLLFSPYLFIIYNCLLKALRLKQAGHNPNLLLYAV